MEIVDRPRKFPHEIYFQSTTNGSIKKQYPEMHSWLKEHLGGHTVGWNIMPSPVNRRLCFKTKEDAMLFKLTFDGEDCVKI